MNRQATSSAGSKFALMALLVCRARTGTAAPRAPGGARRRSQAAASSASDGGGLPTENTDDSAEIGRGSAAFAMRRPPLPANAPQPSPDPRNFDGTWFHEDSLVFYIASGHVR